MKYLLILLFPAIALAWSYVEENGTFYSYTNAPNATLTVRRSTEDYAEMYIESDNLCLPNTKNATPIHVSIDFKQSNKKYFGLLSADSNALFIRFNQELIRYISRGELIEFAYDDCVYEFVVTGDPDELWYLTMYN